MMNFNVNNEKYICQRILDFDYYHSEKPNKIIRPKLTKI